MKNSTSFNALIIVLTVHIFSVHTKLLYYLSPEISNHHTFSYLTLDEPSILAMVFAVSYSLATAFIIYKTNKKWMILTYAGADGLSVLLYYFTKIPIAVSAFYFALYTFFLIASAYYIREKQSPIHAMKANGMTQKAIAEELNISESKVSRTLSKE